MMMISRAHSRHSSVALLTLAVISLFLQDADAFFLQPARIVLPARSYSALFATTLDRDCILEEDYCLPPPAYFESSTVKLQQRLPVDRTPAPYDLPRHTADTTLVSGVELSIGRLAMVAALVLLVTEVTTGQSLPDQVQALFTNVIS
jgi:hypothetical protein